MSRIKGKNTSIERALSRALWHKGIRFRKNSSSVFGHPDISIKKYRIAIFCDGDFWHGYDWENRKDAIKSRREYWIPKIERNIAKDEETNHILSAMGYKVIRIWEYEIRNDIDDVVAMIMRAIEEQRINLSHQDKPAF